jgi:hypothetical protein
VPRQWFIKYVMWIAVTSLEVCVEEKHILVYSWGRLAMRRQISFHFFIQHHSTNLTGVGEYIADSSAAIAVSRCRFGTCGGVFCDFGFRDSSVGELDFFSSFSFFSKPSILFTSASKTSVFGPLFFGIASSKN